MNPMRTLVYIGSEMVVPGGSNLASGHVKWGLGFLVVGSAAASLLGLPAAVLVSLASITTATLAAGAEEAGAKGSRPALLITTTVSYPNRTGRSEPFGETPAGPGPTGGAKLTVLTGDGGGGGSTAVERSARADSRTRKADVPASAAPPPRPPASAPDQAKPTGSNLVTRTRDDRGHDAPSSSPVVEADHPKAAPPPSDLDSAAVRAWARANGYTVNRRGPLPRSLVVAYEKAGTAKLPAT